MVRPFPSTVLRPLYVLTVMVGSFLLFLVQPMIGRIVLPVLGGSPSVWTIAMLFYQAVLLAGYVYAHALQRLPVRLQMAIHLGLFAAASLLLPIGIAPWYPAIGDADPGLWLIGLLLVSIGPVFFVVSAQAPLMQAWFARTGDPGAENPYFLYAASNLGSFAALLAYPLMVEPLFGLPQQRWAWSAGYVILAGLVLACGWSTRGAGIGRTLQTLSISWQQRLRWAGLAAVASGLLLSTTTHLTTDLMAMPLLWVVPLALYLLSFVVGFSDAGPRATAMARRVAPWLLLLVGGPTFLAGTGPGWSVALALAGLALLFVVALALHGGLALDRPPPAGLTSFYLWLSVGGAVGGLFCALIAPLIFSWPWEHPLLLLVAAMLLPWTGPKKGWFGHIRRWGAAMALIGLMLAGGGLDRFAAARAGEHVRSFFGTYSVRDSGDGALRYLRHGTTLHGVQALQPALLRAPMTYYVPQSGVGHAMRIAPALYGPAARIGVVGLGAGTLACYAQPGQAWAFFEIDPAMVTIARRDFSYLSQCAPRARTVVGDARLTLQAEAPGSLDILVVDAFSSDAIPLHMMTREALGVYGRVLRRDGLLLIHITNRFMALEPVIAALAADGGWHARVLRYRPAAADSTRLVSAQSNWVALSRDPAVLAQLAAGGPWQDLATTTQGPVWSDDFASVLPVLRWRRD